MTSHYARSIRQSVALHEATLRHGEPLTLTQAAAALGCLTTSVEDIIKKLARQGHTVPRVILCEKPRGPRSDYTAPPLPAGYVPSRETTADYYRAGLLVMLPPRWIEGVGLAWMVR